MNEETSKRTDVPMNRFDLPAGAKAMYEDFVYRILRTEKADPWEKLTAKQHEQWAQLLKEGIRAALVAKAEKKANTSGHGSRPAWWRY